jgi:hypothetical protein
MMRAQAWMWMAVLTLSSVGPQALAQPPAASAPAAKTKEGKVKLLNDKSLQLESATPGGPPLTYVVETEGKPALKKSLEGIKAGDSVRITYAPNEVGAKVITDLQKL